MVVFVEGFNLFMDDLDDYRDEDEYEDEERVLGVVFSCGC